MASEHLTAQDVIMANFTESIGSLADVALSYNKSTLSLADIDRLTEGR